MDTFRTLNVSDPLHSRDFRPLWLLQRFCCLLLQGISAFSRWQYNEGDVAKEYIEERDGNYYVAGTRISLDSIVHAFSRGESPETICQNFELLQLEEVYGAIAYYLANQADIDAYVMRQNEKWAEGRRNVEPLPADLRERLMRARDELHTARRS
jgi:uncharacterized protein (DUF433 family)